MQLDSLHLDFWWWEFENNQNPSAPDPCNSVKCWWICILEKEKDSRPKNILILFVLSTFCGLNVVSKEKKPFISEMETLFQTMIIKYFCDTVYIFRYFYYCFLFFLPLTVVFLAWHLFVENAKWAQSEDVPRYGGVLIAYLRAHKESLVTTHLSKLSPPENGTLVSNGGGF